MTPDEQRKIELQALQQMRRELAHARAAYQEFIDFKKIAVLMCPQLKIYTRE